MSRKTTLLIIWIVCSLIAAVFALEFTHATYHNAVWHPVGNDSFYHARRILDAINSPRGFYQFDEMIHAPEGSWLTWPWAYDWLMAKFVQLWQVFDPEADSMMIITHMAVYWIFVNAALLIMVAYAINLPNGLIGVVLLAFALSPLTQALHGVGIIDHHYVEYTFILLTLLTGLAWFKRPNLIWRGILLGISLGIAPAFHTGLFILQLPVLFTFFILWMRNELPNNNSVMAFVLAFALGTLVAVSPSEPFQQGQFQFSVLSWFHLYIAAISILFLTAMTRIVYSYKSISALVLLGIVLLVPIWQETLGGTAFLSGKISMLEHISEAQSPMQMALAEKFGFNVVLGHYSIFGLLIPLLIPIYVYRGFKAPNAMSLFFSVMVVFGVSLLLTQYRLNYFGSFAIVMAWALILSERTKVFYCNAKLATCISIIVICLAFMPGINNVLFKKYSLGWDEWYEESLPVIAQLAKRCEDNQGIVLAENNFGHVLRYHTDCSVIANNFLMTPQHEAKVDEMFSYFDLSPEELLAQKPAEMKYLFIRLARFLKIDENGDTKTVNTSFLKQGNRRLAFELNTRNDLPARYK